MTGKCCIPGCSAWLKCLKYTSDAMELPICQWIRRGNAFRNAVIFHLLDTEKHHNMLWLYLILFVEQFFFSMVCSALIVDNLNWVMVYVHTQAVLVLSLININFHYGLFIMFYYSTSLINIVIKHTYLLRISNPKYHVIKFKNVPNVWLKQKRTFIITQTNKHARKQANKQVSKQASTHALTCTRTNIHIYQIIEKSSGAKRAISIFVKRTTPRHDVLMVTGEPNARVREDNTGRERAMGTQGFGCANNNGERLSDLCVESTSQQTGHPQQRSTAYIQPSTQCYAKNRPDSGKEDLAEKTLRMLSIASIESPSGVYYDITEFPAR